MIKKLMICFFTLLAVVLLSQACSATILVIDDFDSGLPINNVGGETGVWSCNPKDAEQFCKMELVDTERVGEEGFSLKLVYDISTLSDYLEGFPGKAFNGYWSLLNGLDVCDYEYLVFYVKGDKNTGYTDTFWVTLRDPANFSKVRVTGITDEWQKIKIPKEDFTDIYDWANVTEFIIVFNETATSEVGILYIDNIAFEQW